MRKETEFGLLTMERHLGVSGHLRRTKVELLRRASTIVNRVARDADERGLSVRVNTTAFDVSVDNWVTLDMVIEAEMDAEELQRILDAATKQYRQ